MVGCTLLKSLLLVSSLGAVSTPDASNLVVVVNKNNPTAELSRTQLIDLYMGKYVAFPDGRKAQPLDIDNNHKLKEVFYKELVGMPLNRVNAYWSRVKFTGRVRPPVQEQDEQAVLQVVATSNSAIAYIQADNITDDVKVVYRFNE
ncbi:hypothetical protein [Planctobacterium marinum]|uniref:hypothetical protein n=1 Tax=Planctobacterium marinum TaxID=1631968 RepID=UPI001E423F04|nr:hypothetical protein [Planctobacterium marinum]MCC2604265.1 hypothetical protein [Planctobacterium marinum]